MLQRLCTRCDQTKPAAEFHRKASGPGGLQPHCISCMKVCAATSAEDVDLRACPRACQNEGAWLGPPGPTAPYNWTVCTIEEAN